MGLHFIILDSTDPSVLGKSIELKPGLIIGRAKGNLIIEDDRISTVHAEIQVNNQGEFFLVDKDSRNGIKVQGKRITKLLLSPGVIFQIGNTLIETTYVKTQPQIHDQKDDGSDLRTEAYDLLENIELLEFNSKKPMFFDKPIKLNVIQGVQLNQSWQLEYGPYKFGSGCVGGILIGDNMPLEVFEVYETNSGKMIRVLGEERVVRLNTILLTNESIIDNGDIISIHLSGNEITRIKFEF
jgi:RNase P/RNase MRP subunit p29